MGFVTEVIFIVEPMPVECARHFISRCLTQRAFVRGPMPDVYRPLPDNERCHRCNVLGEVLLAGLTQRTFFIPRPVPGNNERREPAVTERCWRDLDDVVVAMVLGEKVIVVIVIGWVGLVPEVGQGPSLDAQ